MTILSKKWLHTNTLTGPETGVSSGTMRRVAKYSPIFYEVDGKSPSQRNWFLIFPAAGAQVMPKLRLLCWLCRGNSGSLNLISS
jgi:hypothetical protein